MISAPSKAAAKDSTLERATSVAGVNSDKSMSSSSVVLVTAVWVGADDGGVVACRGGATLGAGGALWVGGEKLADDTRDGSAGMLTVLSAITLMGTGRPKCLSIDGCTSTRRAWQRSAWA